MSIYLSPYIYLSISLSLSLSTYLSLCFSIYIHLVMDLSLYLYFCSISIAICISLYVYLYLYLYITGEKANQHDRNGMIKTKCIHHYNEVQSVTLADRPLFLSSFVFVLVCFVFVSFFESARPLWRGRGRGGDGG